jgi:hypothetical protein
VLLRSAEQVGLVTQQASGHWPTRCACYTLQPESCARVLVRANAHMRPARCPACSLGLLLPISIKHTSTQMLELVALAGTVLLRHPSPACDQCLLHVY